MPKIHEMLESKFLKKEDVQAGVLLTIQSVVQKNVAKQGADPEMKWCLTFVEEDKPFVLNSTNIQLCQAIFGSDDTDEWLNRQIVLYTDPTIQFQGKVIGGVRVRKPKPRAAAPAPIAPPPPPVVAPSNSGVMVEEDEIPFMWAVPFLLPAMLALHTVLA
jgi:hypothetical protein